MAGFSIVLSSLLFLLPTIFAFRQSDLQDPGFVPERDQWWKDKGQYTDKPRYFNLDNRCPASTFYLDCNDCICRKGAIAAQCTSIGCPSVPQIENFGENGQECPIGRRFYHKCNSCTCGSDGKTAKCTNKVCHEEHLDY